MAIQYRTSGFVFKKEDRLEADRVFSVFTKDFGRIEVFGKAIRKINSKLRPGIEIFSLSEIEFIQGRNKKTLTDAILINKFSSFAGHPEKLLLAQRMSKIVDSFVKGQEQDNKIFDLLSDIFYKLDLLQYSALKLDLIYLYFFWNFVSALGYKPELFKCAKCGQKLNPSDLYFSSSEGGVICKDCCSVKDGALRIDSDAVKILRIILKNPPAGGWETLSKLKIEISKQQLLKEITEHYYLYLRSNFISGIIDPPT